MLWLVRPASDERFDQFDRPALDARFECPVPADALRSARVDSIVTCTESLGTTTRAASDEMYKGAIYTMLWQKEQRWASGWVARSFLAFIFAAAAQGTPGFGDDAPEALQDLAKLASGWRGEIVAKIDQSYVGWDVEIGDADNDGGNEILVTGCPDSRLYLFKKIAARWETRLLAENLAHRHPGMGLVVKVVDLDGDGRNELILGTGQEMAEPAYFYMLETDGRRLVRRLASRPLLADSGFTHNLGCHDLDGDGLLEVVAAYCSSGEIVRFDFDENLTQITARKIHQHSGSGEDSHIADVDNDGRAEYVTVNGYQPDKATVEIYDFDSRGELILPPRVVIDGFDGQKCFVAAVEVGDVDNNGRLELIVGWNRIQKVNKGTILGYRVDGKKAKRVWTFAYEDDSLDYGYFEKMMCVADADNDGKNELLVTTRGEPAFAGHADSSGLGHVFLFKVADAQPVTRTLLLDFHQGKANSSWPAVGDADNDGKNEVVIATGVGHRKKPGASHVLLVEKE